MLSWPLLMLLQNTFASIYALQSRKLAAKYKKAHFQILAAVFGCVYVVFLVYAFLNIHQINLSSAMKYSQMIALTGILFTIWTVLTFIIFRYVDAAIGTLLSALNLIAVVIVASVVIHESLTPLQALGAALLIGSIFIVGHMHKTKLKKHNWQLGLTLTIVASIFFGFAIASEKFLLGEIGMPTYAVFGIGAQMLPLLLLALLYRRSEFRHFRKKAFRRDVALMGFVRGGAGILFVVSLVKADNASLIGVMSGVKIILTTILAAILLKELMFIKRKIVAAVIASIGVGLMVW